jgi:predicted RNase H-like HicB family nuclease
MATRARADIKATITIRRPFRVNFAREATGGYSASVPDLPGCYSEGDTLGEAKRNVREAIACHLEALAALSRAGGPGATGEPSLDPDGAKGGRASPGVTRTRPTRGKDGP